jgi:hypothetical protein
MHMAIKLSDLHQQKRIKLPYKPWGGSAPEQPWHTSSLKELTFLLAQAGTSQMAKNYIVMKALHGASSVSEKIQLLDARLDKAALINAMNEHGGRISVEELFHVDLNT